MNKYEGPLVGILGAIIIHLVVAIVFMAFQLYSLKSENPAEFLIEFEKEPLPEIEEEKIIIPKSVEELFANDEKYLNIARNLAKKPTEDIDVDNYIDKVKEELIESGKLGRDNYIDDWKNRENQPDQGETALEQLPKPEEKKKESKEMEANYRDQQEYTITCQTEITRDYLYLFINVKGRA